MTSHNDSIRQEVVETTEELRDNTRGDGVVTCPDCGDQVPWGSVLSHRIKTCHLRRV